MIGLLMIIETWYLFCFQGNQHNRSVMLNSKVIDYINFILRAGEFKNCDASQVNGHFFCSKIYPS